MNPDIKRKMRPLGNEDGSVLVVALLMMVFLSLLGLSSTTTSSIELQIAGNDRSYKQNLYRAEAAAMEAVQRLENETSEQVLVERTADWLHDSDMMNVIGNWNYDDSGGDDNAETADATGTVSMRWGSTRKGIAE